VCLLGCLLAVSIRLWCMEWDARTDKGSGALFLSAPGGGVSGVAGNETK
jgi:hypothetical protein